MYDLSGHVITELNTSGQWTRAELYAGGRHIGTYDPATTYFSHIDWLGTEHAVTNYDGSFARRCADQPWGEERQCSGIGGSPIYFTGKERDAVTGLDYFGARYYGSTMGRFVSVDKVIVTPARLEDPQRLNLYGYGRNNPLAYVDTNGEDIDLVNDTEEGRKRALAALTKGMTSAEAANIGARQDKNGNWETYVKDKDAVSMKDASVAYKGVTGVINDHSVTVNVGLVGGGLTATFPGLGRVSSTSEFASTLGSSGDRNVNVLVTPGSYAPGVQVSTPYGLMKGSFPDFVAMYHEAVGETLKYRAGYEYLQNKPMLDSRTVIKIENEFRKSLGMYPRTGSDHGGQVITVDGGSSK